MFFQIIFFLISLIPNNKLKITLFNFLPNTFIDQKSKVGFGVIFRCNKIKIFNSKIGNLNFIECKYFDLSNSKIANNNLFINIKKFKAQNHSIIGSHNILISKKGNSNVYIKMENSQISSNFRLNLSKNLYLGKKVILGGMNTKIIDDAYSNSTRSTILLKNIFVGSNVIIKNGVRISNNIIIGANTLIDKDLLLSGRYFSKTIEIFEL